ncbi:VOC family protein [Streptomyces sp. NPDC093252]|uniref:VOC family protein n=1 Tax=Streptomyces sp. NPDC093252 TaxID=3154980 RepID=UPI003432D5C0
MAEVTGLGYVVVDATDLGAWQEYACGLLGMQSAVDTADRLVLRIDHKAYRLDIRRADRDAVAAIGWEVRGPRELDALTRALEDGGYAVKRLGGEAAARRGVSGLAEFDDPDGQRLELFWGSREAADRFTSPTGAGFVTGTGGMGHVFQFVRDEAAHAKLYFDILGFRLSDHIDFGPGMSATFAHCNERHHSIAWAVAPGLPPGVGHLMFEVDELDHVGRAWSRARGGAAPITMEFGKHTNDEMLSFYSKTPSGFQVEYGYGGRLIDDTTWTPARYDATSYWGHEFTEHRDPDEPDV